MRRELPGADALPATADAELAEVAEVLGALLGPAGSGPAVGAAGPAVSIAGPAVGFAARGSPPLGAYGPLGGRARLLRAGERLFDVELTETGEALHVIPGLERLLRRRAVAQALPPSPLPPREPAPRQPVLPLPLLVAPFMGKVAAELCAREGVGWLDLSGNARISAPGLHIHVDGRPDRFRRRGRPASLFAPRSAIVARELLAYPDTHFSRHILGLSTGVHWSYVSKIVKRLYQAGLLEKDGRGRVRPARPKLLLESLREAYEGTWTKVLRGRLEADSPESLLRLLAETLEMSLPYALTGRAAAWLRLGADENPEIREKAPLFEMASVMLTGKKATEVEWEALPVQMDAPNPNVAFLLTDDDSPFVGRALCKQVWVAHPSQIYFDLLAPPEPDREAAELIRKRFLDYPR